MFRRKQDVDKHVNSILLRKRDEKERNVQGYQIARLYADIKEYSIARRYLSGFLSVRENVPSAYQLMGEINEGLGQKEAAVDNYKRALDLGGFVSSNKYLVQKICKLYTEIGTDVPRMEHWLEQLEKLDPKSDMVFQLKAQIAEVASANGENKDEEMENIISSELVKRPTDLKLRIKLLKLYLNTNRCDEAYDVAVTCDLTTAFVGDLPWFECLCTVFKKYGELNPDTQTDTLFTQHYLHVLRNLVYLSLPLKTLDVCVEALNRFDKHLKFAVNMGISNETWAAMLKEMKGQMFFLASLILLKRAQTGSISWQDVNHLSGACLLASKSIGPLDAQAPWFVSAPTTHKKFYDWWHQQSNDRLSQVGHMIGQLSRRKKWQEITEWGLSVRRDTMTADGHQRVFEQLFCPRDVSMHGATSFFFQAQEMVVGHVREREPFTEQHLLDIDRVAYQVHLGNLNHLVWLCLQRYSSDMDAQPNYHFTLMENIQFSVKNLEDTAAESLSQLDILVFLLTTVRCAASVISENTLRYGDSCGRPNILPVSLAKSLCSPEQEEWWTAAFRFCTNTIKDDFSRLRRVLVRGLETVRLLGSHGISVKMMCHIARSLDARVKSYRSGQHGCRCSAYDLNHLESRAAFYWEKAKLGLQKALRNQHTPMPKKRLFKEAGDMDMSPVMLRPLLDEAVFALAVHAMKGDRLEEAIKGFEKLNTPWAKFLSAKIYKKLSDREASTDSDLEESLLKRKALASRARDYLYDTLDRLEGDKSHELNVPVYNELDNLDVLLHDLELDERNASPSHSFHTPLKSPSEIRIDTPGFSEGRAFMAHSTPRHKAQGTNGTERSNHSKSRVEPDDAAEEPEISSSSDRHDMTAVRPRPSPERLDAQLKSVTYSQSSMFKMVLERNDELIVINSKLMEELRGNNNQLKTMLGENQGLMSDLKSFLGENRDMMKQIKQELGDLKAGIAQQAAAPPPPPIAPTPPVFLPPHMAGVPPRGPPYPSFPPPAYPTGPGYMINSPMPGPAPPRPPTAPTMGPQYRPSGLPGAHTSNVGKYRSPSDEDDEEVDPEDLTSAEEAAAFYAEYCDDAAYSQYFTPDSQIMQDWTGRSAMEGPPPQMNMAPPAPMPPRMSMPSPGYFASALRGQSLQYAQNTPPPAQVRPPPLGPGFFSSPLTSTVTSATATSTPSLFAALTGQSSASPGMGSFAMPTSGVKVETSSVPVSTPVNLGPTLSGLKSLFQSKGVLEPSKAKGDITILVDTNSRRATILMMGETKDIIFHHDIQGLALEQSLLTASPATIVTWVATKIGTAGEREKVSLGLESQNLAAQLKEAIQRATALIQPKTTAQAGSPKLPGHPNATSTPITSGVSAATAGAPLGASIFSLSSLTPSTSTSAKPTFGGFTFTTAPVVAPVTTAAEKVKQEASLSVAGKDNAPKPFANFTLTPSAAVGGTSPLGASQKSPQATKSPGTSTARGDDDHVEEYEPNVDFKPVIDLPDLVEKTTGEENETALFVERCRLFRFDVETKQWKERGIGDLKILSSKDQIKFRIIMRRDQILKLCANHCLSADMKLTPMQSSDRAWCYTAMDFSEEEMKLEQLAAKFKNAEKAEAFKECFTKCCQQLKDAESKSPAHVAAKLEKTPSKDEKSSGQKTKPASSKEETAKAQQPLSELFKPKPGSWECDVCMIRNNGDVDQCPACGNMKPGVKSSAAAATSGQSLSFGAKPAAPASSGTGFNFGSKAGSGFSFGAPTTTASGTGFVFGTSTATASTSPSSGIKFGQQPSTTASSGAAGGFKFGAPPQSTAAVSATTTTPAASGGFKFGAPPQSTAATSATTTTSASGGFKFGAPPQSTAATSATTTTSASGGFKFGAPPQSTAATSATTTTSASGGFKFGAPPQSTAATSATTTTSASGGFKFGAPPQSTAATSATTTTAASGFKFDALPQSTAAASASTTTPSASGEFKFGAPQTQSKAGTAAFMFKPQSVPATVTTTSSSAPTSGFSFKLPAAFAATTAASSEAVKPSLFSFSTTRTTTTTASSSDTKACGSCCAGSGGLLAQLLTSEGESTTLPKPVHPEPPKPAPSGFNFSMAPKSSSALSATGGPGTSKGFQFSFPKSPAKPAGSPSKPAVPGSPEIDEQGLYITKEGDDSHIHFEPVVALPDKIEVKTGEEDEAVLFESRGKLYRFVSGEWKEKGLGVVKILEHKLTKKTRVLMRRDQILKICCNHFINRNLNLQPMAKTEGKAWVWYALDFSEEEGKMEQLALRFKTAEIANDFKTVFDKCREAYKESPAKTEEPVSGNVTAVKKELFKADSSSDRVALESDDDVIFVREEKPTPEQIAKARKYQLPDCFYLYESKPPCPGCIGCTDGEYDPQKQNKSVNSPKEAAKPVQSPVVSTATLKFSSPVSFQPKAAGASVSQPVFGSAAAVSTSSQPSFGSIAANLPDFSKLTSDSKSDRSSGNDASESSGFVFGSKATVDFSSLAASGGSGEFAWKKTDLSGPFSFAGAGQKLFGRSGGDHEGGGDDGVVAPSDDIHFEPVIPLPDLVQIKTGEEDWKSLFAQRSKLYKFDKKLQQWKERGIGEIKIMQHNSQVMFRVIQRREQVLKVACNHLISLDMKLNPLATSETAWCWTATDFTEAEPSVEQFAIKFKNKELAQEFKDIFEKCQETLRINGGKSPGQTSHHGKCNNHSPKAKDIAVDDFIVSSTFKAREEKYLPKLNFGNTLTELSVDQQYNIQICPQVQNIKAATLCQQGGKGNPYMTQALDVAGADIISATTFSQQGDKGNPYMTQALDVAGADIMAATMFSQQGDKGNPYYSRALDVAGADTMTATTFSQQGDKGNPYMTQALDVAGADTMTATTFSQQGDKGNPYMTQALDVAGADIMTATTFSQQGDKGNPYMTQALDVTGADTMAATTFSQQGDKGNPYMTQALDVAGADTMTATTFSQQGDKGNPYMTQALDVAGADIMAATMFSQQGDKGNPYMTQALDVAGADTMTATTFSQQGDKGNPYYSRALNVAGADSMTATTFSQQGDKGNPYMTQALDVAGADIMAATMFSQQGDKGNPYMTQALDVAGADTMTATTFSQQGDKGNPYMTQALDVAGADIMTATTFSQQGDKGNPYMTQALDVAGADIMAATTFSQQGDKGNPHMTQALDVAGADIMTATTFSQQGDKGNPHMTQALDVAGADIMAATTFSQQGDKGNPYYSRALDVAGADIMAATTFSQQGDKGNPHMTQALDVLSTSSQQEDKENLSLSQTLNIEDSHFVKSKESGEEKLCGAFPNQPPSPYCSLSNKLARGPSES
ncbi:hypothetical protein RRG08_048139 [Elysia crispata]|uniref:E3 SUMO-protein ligase RanBP2 n=1 Tax=Elysia crispata TaxID=231223 RepID=A0AAE0ZI77_9GAST|nr:hypothetical protein RRG08_048139 [Elysia crispata]